MLPLLAVGLLAVGLLAVGCVPDPPPWWTPPTFQSVVYSSTEVVAGSSFTVTRTVSDDHHVARVTDFAFFHVSSLGWPIAVPCEVADWKPGPVVTVEATCTMPAIAPNGAWRLQVQAYDGEYSGGEGSCACGSSETAFTGW